MGIGIGFPKYIIGVLLSPWAFICMYIFGAGKERFISIK